MKGVLISIRPKWCEKIASGEKTIEVRKTAPKQVPFKCYIYCTKPKKPKKYTLHTYINSGYGRKEFGVIGQWRSGKEVVDVNFHLPACRYNAYLAEGKVIGEFVCDKVYELSPFGIGTGIELLDELVSPEMFCKESCLTEQEICDYIGEKDGYGWHISDLKIYDEPKELSEFKKTRDKIAMTCGMQARNGLCRAIDHEELCDNIKCCFKTPRPSQSWCYVEELKNEP